jgi:hypothetical protein
MTNAGLVPYVVVEDFLARFWANVLPAIQLHPEVRDLRVEHLQVLRRLQAGHGDSGGEAEGPREIGRLIERQIACAGVTPRPSIK